MPDGLTTLRSQYDAAETVRRLRAAVQQAGLTIFADIDHRQNALDAGLELRPTRLIIFGNGKGGTPLMQLNQTAGLDLPLKALVWEDEGGAAWLSYNELAWVAGRHGLGAGADPVVAALSAGLQKLAAAATG
jgi:uncharacterized protein (DUF302 family)